MPLASRRRAIFGLESGGGNIAFGYRRTRSHELVDIDTCPILSPRIVSRLSDLKALLAPLCERTSQAPCRCH